jgi:hypothetical protein
VKKFWAEHGVEILIILGVIMADIIVLYIGYKDYVK